MATLRSLDLPAPVLLLLQLHLLGYPLANQPEYDEHMFNPRTRGLRDRTKTMEAVVHFLVTKSEGKRVKQIIPVYPCLTPTDTTNFRMAVTKYSEALRHDALSDPGRQWWKDVVVRKSVIEECSGDKFERLLLALATHAVRKASPPLQEGSDVVISDLNCAPELYARQVANSKTLREGHKFSKAIQDRAWDAILSLRRHPERDDDDARTSEYQGIPTESLLALSRTTYENLAARHWPDDDLQQALDGWLNIVGVAKPSATALSTSDTFSSLSSTCSRSPIIEEIRSRPPVPLPIAAAHHPSHLRKLQVFISATGKPMLQPSRLVIQEANETRPSACMFEFQADDMRLHEALRDALETSRRFDKEIGTLLNTAKTRYASHHAKTNPTPLDLHVMYHDRPPWQYTGIIDLASYSDLFDMEDKARTIRRDTQQSIIPHITAKEEAKPSMIPQRVIKSSTDMTELANSSSIRAASNIPKSSLHLRLGHQIGGKYGTPQKHPKKATPHKSQRRTKRFSFALKNAARHMNEGRPEQLEGITDSIEDGMPSPENPVPRTPKGKRIPVPGTPLSSTAKKRLTPRATYDWEKHNAGVSLPSLPNLADITDDEDDEELSGGRVATSTLPNKKETLHADDWVDEPFEEEDSLVIWDLLIKSGVGRRGTFLLSDKHGLLTDDSFEWD